MKLSGNFYTVIVVAMGLGSIVYLWSTQPQIAPIYMAAALPLIVGVIATLQKSQEAVAKVETAVQQSQENSAQIAAVTTKVDDNTATTNATHVTNEKTHTAVNSRMDQMIAQMENMAKVQEQLVAAQKLAEGIAIGREQMGAAPDTPASPVPPSIVDGDVPK